MNNFKEKFKLYIKKRTQRVSVFGLTVTIDWYFILFCFAVLTCVGLVYSILFYNNISSGHIFNVESLEQEVHSDDSATKRDQIEETINYLQKS